MMMGMMMIVVMLMVMIMISGYTLLGRTHHWKTYFTFKELDCACVDVIYYKELDVCHCACADVIYYKALLGAH